ncbi:MAG: hypothetical protein ACRDH8_08865 [Actinomycetota bacterium]
MEPEPKVTGYSLGDGIAMVLSFLLHGGAAMYFFLSVLVVPAPILILLFLGWGGLLAVLIIHRHRPWFVLMVPVADAVLWLALVPGLNYFIPWTV